MEIYIQSAGASPDCGYCWLKKVPPHLDDISKYIQIDSPSVALVRSNNKLFTLVTELESLNKKDFRSRKIRHCVAWECEDNDDNERLIRAIAIQALRGQEELAERIDQLILFSGGNGFKFDETALKSLSDKILAQTELKQNPPDIQAKMGKNSDVLRSKLVKELENNALPKGDKILLVVTGIKKESTLVEGDIWRSLSNLVKEEKEDEWKNIPKKELQQPNFKMAVLALVALLAIALILWIIFVSR